MKFYYLWSNNFFLVQRSINLGIIYFSASKLSFRFKIFNFQSSECTSMRTCSCLPRKVTRRVASFVLSTFAWHASQKISPTLVVHSVAKAPFLCLFSVIQFRNLLLFFHLPHQFFFPSHLSSYHNLPYPALLRWHLPPLRVTTRIMK